MAAYDIRPLQLHILDILLAIDKVCREHGLRYYLAAGTLLGAVRHQGFIPWDDDVDIAMPRKDYDLLMQHCKEWLPQPYEGLFAENDPDYPGNFAKVIDSSTTLIERAHHAYIGGVYVDVFPIDGMTSNKLMQRLHFAQYSFYKKIIYLICRDPYKHGHGPSSWLPLLCRKFFTLKEAQAQLLSIQRKYSDRERELLVDHDFGMKGIMAKTIYGTPTKIMFEGHPLYGVEQADKYLSLLYGDYMTIPPGEKQRQHNFYYLDYHLPYRQYVDTREFVNNKSINTSKESSQS